MWDRRFILLGAICASLGIGTFFAVRAWNERQEGIDDKGIDSIKVVSSESLSGTRVTPVTTLPFDPKLNCICCGVFQLAWNELTELLANGPLLLDGSPPAATELNGMRFTRDDASTCQIQVAAGPITAELLEECADKLRDINAARPELLNRTPNPENFIAYGVLEKTLRFAKRFDALEPSIFHGASGDAKVEFFGYDAAQHDRDDVLHELFQQVFVADYVSEVDFVLCLNADSDKDDMVLARVPPRQTLHATVDAVSQRVAAARKKDDWWEHGYRGEVLQVPVVTVGVMHQFQDLGRRFVNLDGSIGSAFQAIRFKLDRSGAILRSEARIEKDAKLDTMNEPKKPRKFIFDGPFLLYLSKRGSPRPYFVAWIANAELLQRVE